MTHDTPTPSLVDRLRATAAHDLEASYATRASHNRIALKRRADLMIEAATVLTPVMQPEIDALEGLVWRNRTATERMYEIDRGVGGLGVAHPEMLDDWSAYQDAITADSDEPTLPEKLLNALAAERTRTEKMVPREQYDRQLGRLADDCRRHLVRARAAEREREEQRARADQAERDVQRAEQRYGGMAGEREAMKEQWLDMRRERDAADVRADQAEQRIADAPHDPTCFIHSFRKVASYCNCWKKSAAPTAEQGADQ